MITMYRFKISKLLTIFKSHWLEVIEMLLLLQRRWGATRQKVIKLVPLFML